MKFKILRTDNELILKDDEMGVCLIQKMAYGKRFYLFDLSFQDKMFHFKLEKIVGTDFTTFSVSNIEPKEFTEDDLVLIKQAVKAYRDSSDPRTFVNDQIRFKL